MVLHHQRQPFLARVERRAFGDRPTLQDAIEFQPEIVMEAGSLVPLHDEDKRVFHASSLLKLLHFSNLPLLLHGGRLHQRCPSRLLLAERLGELLLPL
jgi:hypothetical protein